ncbi:hypothetical protein SM12BL1_39670 [Serratia marcescens]|uniref:hypothetical protein n=1 Tax=Serratia marcescens TaxID=615 RepID=UPI0007450442|nr:hypothetical protein [Serratia marcescens]CUZ93511.1 Uncharacterised protein [Serratia marcescens]CVA66605.1 Uncharacterised protein [Serratia marcescens]CVB76736.1 Uncharacterised protein [Serratia marcescens]CVC60829.1 Uncharacterised protein [Serratia marcescens]CVD56093.1 Uncharacterised protein [Serratia marcescens]
MKIDYQDHGATASITLTSTVFELRRHNRVVDTALFLTSVSAHRSGLFFMKTVLSGRSAAVLKAYKVVLREMAR